MDITDEQMIELINSILNKAIFDFKLIVDSDNDIYIPLDELQEEYRIKDVVKVDLKNKNVKINNLNSKKKLKNDEWTILRYVEMNDDLGVEVAYTDKTITAFIPWSAMIEVVE